MPDHDRPAHDPAYDRSAPPAAGSSWPAGPAEQRRSVGVVDPYTEQHGWSAVPPAAPVERTFGAKATAAIAAGAFLVGAAAAILIGGLTGPAGGPGGGPGGGMPPGVSSSQDGRTGATPGQGTSTGT